MAGALNNFLDNAIHNARNAFTDEPPANVEVMALPEEQGFLSSLNELSQLSYTQRLTAFFAVLCMGLVFLFIAVSFVPMVYMVPSKFAFFLTIGNVFCLCSTVFLVGVRHQLEYMFQAHRFQAACLYVASVVMTLLCVVRWKSIVGCLVFCVVQIAALMWYILSFVPFARYTVARLASYLCSTLRLLLQGCLYSVRHCYQLVRG